MIIEKKFIRKTQKKTNEFEYLIECDNCKERFIFIGTEAKLQGKRFCSIKCRNKFVKNWINKDGISKGLKKYYSKNTVWNKNLSKNTDIRVKKISDGLKKSEKFQKTIHSKEYSEKMSKRNLQNGNPFFGKTHSKQNKENWSKQRSEKIADGSYNFKNRGIKGYFYSKKNNDKFYYDSFWELIRMIILDNDTDVVSWTKKHNIKLKYVYNDNQKYYIPDFLIKKNNEVIIEEVKGYENEEKKQIKFKILNEYAVEHNLKISILQFNDINLLCLKLFKKNINTLRKEFKNASNFADWWSGLYR
jgi:hypothetical protein